MQPAPFFMRHKQTPLLLLAAASIGFMGFLLQYSSADRNACDKDCPLRKKAASPAKQENGELVTHSITHMIAFVRK